MTRAEIRTSVRRMIDESFNGFWDTNLLNDYINMEYRKLINMINNTSEFYVKTSTITSTASSATIAMPSDCSNKIIRLTDSSGIDILPYSRRNLDISSSNTGTPVLFDIRGKYIWLSPTPDSAQSFILEYHYIPPALVNESDSIDFPNGYEDVIIYGVALMAKIRDNDSTSDLERQYLTMRREMLNHLQENQSFGPRMVNHGLGGYGLYEDL